MGNISANLRKFVIQTGPLVKKHSLSSVFKYFLLIKAARLTGQLPTARWTIRPARQLLKL
jgi:hypothetical protein